MEAQPLPHAALWVPAGRRNRGCCSPSFSTSVTFSGSNWKRGGGWKVKSTSDGNSRFVIISFYCCSETSLTNGIKFCFSKNPRLEPEREHHSARQPAQATGKRSGWLGRILSVYFRKLYCGLTFPHSEDEINSLMNWVLHYIAPLAWKENHFCGSELLQSHTMHYSSLGKRKACSRGWDEISTN